MYSLVEMSCHFLVNSYSLIIKKPASLKMPQASPKQTYVIFSAYFASKLMWL